MFCENLALIAAAGSGKTTFIVNEIAQVDDGKILLLTYTNANTNKLRCDIVKKYGIHPNNLEIMTWHRFLLIHCIRPFRSYVWKTRIDHIDFDTPIKNFRIPETNTRGFYFSSVSTLYKDRASKFAIKCNLASNNAVINRLETIYSCVFIDEVQDFGGDDIDLLELLFRSKMKITVVGDIRQAIYFTCNARKNKGNRGSKLLNKFLEWEQQGIVKIGFRDYSYRCKQAICDLSDSIFPNIDEKTISRNDEQCDHEGIYLVRSKDIDAYLNMCNPMILRWNVRAKLPSQNKVNTLIRNIGLCKGATYDHVLILCTDEFKNFISKGIVPEKEKVKSELYVAITRARFSVAFLYDGQSFNQSIYKVFNSNT